jgi:hypothetical protein
MVQVRGRWAAVGAVAAVWLGACTCRPGPGVTDAGGGDAAADGGGPGDSGGPDGGAINACVAAGGTVCGALGLCCTGGTDCVDETSCLTPCASGVRCGPSLAECCAAGDVCFGPSCATPGAPCATIDDCALDEVCDPTLMACIARPPIDCTYVPPPGAFDPQPEWSWTGLSSDALIRNVFMTPAVADVDADGLPEVVVNAFNDTTAATLVVLNGEDGSEVDAMVGATRRSSHVAIADLDADPELEIIAFHQPLGVARFDLSAAGVLSETWVADTGPLAVSLNAGGPSIADLDGDGTPEIVVGRIVLDTAGNVVADRGGGGNHTSAAMLNGWISLVADVDEDGNPDVVIGNGAYTLDPADPTGLAVLWENAALPDGLTAVGDLFTPGGGGPPDVVTVSEGNLYVLAGATGAILEGPIALPGGGSGGAPTIADFDGDSVAEIGVAALAFYTVFDLECVPPAPAGCSGTPYVRWSMPTDDTSSNVTGSSVFDFEGDGPAEVVYNDECYLRVYDGATGMVKLERPNSTRTATENPIVVDVDGDYDAEIVVAANDYLLNPACPMATVGVTAFGDTLGNWVRTRPVWNEHTYHITNVLADGSIPTVELNNWDVAGFNNFRMNTLGRAANDVPDLVAVSLQAGLANCPDTIALVATVSNAGVISAPAGVAVSFYRDLSASAPDTLIDTRYTLAPLLPGATVVVTTTYAIPVADRGMPLDYYVVVDDDGTGTSTGAVTECDESNNVALLAGQLCQFLL